LFPLGPTPIAQRPELGDPDVKGFLQLCSDRRFHLKIMEAFEADTDFCQVAFVPSV
jgi:hypothetical protein